jgi:hypothetical protein
MRSSFAPSVILLVIPDCETMSAFHPDLTGLAI